MGIYIKDLSKKFGAYQALNGIDLTVADGELVALLGPSGSGKTTLLRIIAGLESADSGEVDIDNQQSHQKVSDRKVGFVFQHYALFRHMSVFENVAFGLRVMPGSRRPSKEIIKARVLELLRLVQLDGLEKRYPAQLSGGQRQRVALARALAIEPKVLLLDEPFGALDARVRQELRRWLRRLHDDLHMTSLFVTHDQEEALEVADRIVVMNKGQIEQVGSPQEVYDHPATPFVYNFLGRVNLFHGRAHDGVVTMGSLTVDSPDGQQGSNGQVTGYVRPHDLEVSRERLGSDSLPAIIKHVYPVGGLVRLELEQIGTGAIIDAEVTRDEYHQQALKAGDNVYVKPKKDTLFLDFDPGI